MDAFICHNGKEVNNYGLCQKKRMAKRISSSKSSKMVGRSSKRITHATKGWMKWYRRCWAVASLRMGMRSISAQSVLGKSQMPLTAVVKLSYQERMKRAYGQDPLRCEQCGAPMWLWQVWHPKDGLVYDEGEAIKAGKYEPTPQPKPPDVVNKPVSLVQLSLFDLQAPLSYA